MVFEAEMGPFTQLAGLSRTLIGNDMTDDTTYEYAVQQRVGDGDWTNVRLHPDEDAAAKDFADVQQHVYQGVEDVFDGVRTVAEGERALKRARELEQTEVRLARRPVGEWEEVF